MWLCYPRNERHRRLKVIRPACLHRCRLSMYLLSLWSKSGRPFSCTLRDRARADDGWARLARGSASQPHAVCVPVSGWKSSGDRSWVASFDRGLAGRFSYRSRLHPAAAPPLQQRLARLSVSWVRCASAPACWCSQPASARWVKRCLGLCVLLRGIVWLRPAAAGPFLPLVPSVGHVVFFFWFL